MTEQAEQTTQVEPPAPSATEARWMELEWLQVERMPKCPEPVCVIVIGQVVELEQPAATFCISVVVESRARGSRSERNRSLIGLLPFLYFGLTGGAGTACHKL